MKILILTEGGQNIGFGHLSRCIALSQEIKEQDVHAEVEFIVNGDRSAEKFLKNENISNALLFDWSKNEKRALDLIRKADMAIIDSYRAGVSLYQVISEAAGGRIIMIDDYNRIPYPDGIIVNPSIRGNEMLYSSDEEGRKDRILGGKDYIILRREFWEVPDKKLNKNVNNVLVTFGGTDDSQFFKAVIRHLRSRFDCSFYAVDARKNRIDAREMLDLMFDADLCISAGGQTIYELARIGVPTIAICFAENQLGNLNGLQKAGFIEYAGWYDDERILSEISDRLVRLSDFDTRLHRSRLGRSLVDGRGARRIIRDSFHYFGLKE